MQSRDSKKINTSVYSCYFEMRLEEAQFGLSDGEHFTICNQKLSDFIRNLNDQGIELCPEITNEDLLSSLRSKTSSPGDKLFTWHHCTSGEANGRFGVMRLVSYTEHRSNTKTFHPEHNKRGGHYEWALPAGAPSREHRRISIHANISTVTVENLPHYFKRAVLSNCFDDFNALLNRAKQICSPLQLQTMMTQFYEVGKTDKKATLLHIAAKNGHLPMINAILSCGGNIQDFLKIKNQKGDTPAHIAADSNRYEVLKLLKNNGNDVSVKNNKNQTAYDIAKSRNYVACIPYCNPYTSSVITYKSLTNKHSSVEYVKPETIKPLCGNETNKGRTPNQTRFSSQQKAPPNELSKTAKSKNLKQNNEERSKDEQIKEKQFRKQFQMKSLAQLQQQMNTNKKNNSMPVKNNPSDQHSSYQKQQHLGKPKDYVYQQPPQQKPLHSTNTILNKISQTPQHYQTVGHPLAQHQQYKQAAPQQQRKQQLQPQRQQQLQQQGQQLQKQQQGQQLQKQQQNQQLQKQQQNQQLQKQQQNQQLQRQQQNQQLQRQQQNQQLQRQQQNQQLQRQQQNQQLQRQQQNQQLQRQQQNQQLQRQQQNQQLQRQQQNQQLQRQQQNQQLQRQQQNQQLQRQQQNQQLQRQQQNQLQQRQQQGQLQQKQQQGQQLQRQQQNQQLQRQQQNQQLQRQQQNQLQQRQQQNQLQQRQQQRQLQQQKQLQLQQQQRQLQQQQQQQQLLRQQEQIRQQRQLLLLQQQRAQQQARLLTQQRVLQMAQQQRSAAAVRRR